MKKIYLDYAATTPIDPRVLKAMLPYLKENFGNTASMHFFGRKALEALEESRRIIAQALGAQDEEIFFTASATESNNTVLKGIANAYKQKGKHIIISSVEHDCVLNSAKWLSTQGFEVTRLSVNKDGLINPAEVTRAIKKDTILVSVMHANNEIGTLEPIKEIGQICRNRGVLFHTDASQSFGKIPLDVNKDNIDLLTASSHKLYGPRGAALLYVKKGVKITPLLHGGGHELGMRSSTVNVAAIVGFAQAVKLCLQEMDKESKRQIKLRDKLIKNILTKIPNTFLNGHPTKRLPNNANLRFSGIEGEGIMMHLDNLDIAVSTGSACSSQSLQPSHVLTACGLPSVQIHGSIRFSLGRWTTNQEIDYLLKVLPGIVKKLRSISPFGRN